jgi:hypothetical protein
MRIIFTFLILFSAQIFSQTYLGITFNNGDPISSTDVSLIKKIVFSNSDITFLLSDNSSVTRTLSTIGNMTFSGTNLGNPLPVELVSFTASVNRDIVTLEWSTATEVNNYGFEIERTPIAATQDWMKIGFVNGYGNSNSPKEYSFTDAPQGNTKFNYRLKQIDNDGTYEYSSIVMANLGTPNQYILNQNFPNPFNPTTKISYSLPNEGFITIKIFDVLGNEVATLVNENKKSGNYEVLFDGSKLASGLYICNMSAADFSNSIKMIIMK